MDLGIKGKKAIINGGSAGMGKGSALALAKEGAILPIPIESRPLEQANSALDDLRDGNVTGRIVLKP